MREACAPPPDGVPTYLPPSPHRVSRSLTAPRQAEGNERAEGRAAARRQLASFRSASAASLDGSSKEEQRRNAAKRARERREGQSDEQKKARREAAARYVRERRRQQRARESPEQTKARLEKEAEQKGLPARGGLARRPTPSAGGTLDR